MPQTSRPSKDDLAALDQLLNARATENPATSVQKAGAERWAPKFGTTEARPGTKGGGARREGSRSPLVIGGIAAAVLLGAAAAYWLYLRPSATSPPRPARAASAAPSTLTATRGGGLSDPREAAPSVSAGTPSPAPADAGPAAAAVAPTPAAPAGDARSLLQAGRFPESARRFAAEVKAAPRGTSSIQLLIACAPDTIQKAVDNVGAQELVVVPHTFQGKSCYRLCWGLYPTSARAASAVPSIPAYFKTRGASPKVLSAAELAP